MRSPLRAALAVLVLGSLATGLAGPASAAAPTAARWHQRAEPLVLGHRGAAGYRPEHTESGYALAAAA